MQKDQQKFARTQKDFILCGYCIQYFENCLPLYLEILKVLLCYAAHAYRYLKKLNTFFIIMSKCSYVTTSISYMMARHCVLCDKNIQQNSLPWLFQCHNQSKVGRQRSNRDHLDSCRSSVHVAVQRCRIIHSSHT